MDTVAGRARAAVTTAWRLFCSVALIFAALLWVIVSTVLVGLRAAKRIWFCSAMWLVLCLWGAGSLRHTAHFTLVASLSAALSALWMIVGAGAWREYRDKLHFLARAQLHGRRVIVGPDWRELRRRPRCAVRWLGWLTAIALFALAAAAPLAWLQLVATAIYGASAVALAWQLASLWRVEYAEGATFFHDGWRAPAPETWEDALLTATASGKTLVEVRLAAAELVRPLTSLAVQLVCSRDDCVDGKTAPPTLRLAA